MTEPRITVIIDGIYKPISILSWSREFDIPVWFRVSEKGLEIDLVGYQAAEEFRKRFPEVR